METFTWIFGVAFVFVWIWWIVLKFIDHNKPDLMYKEAGLDAESIVSKVFDTLNSKIIVQKQN